MATRVDDQSQGCRVQRVFPHDPAYSTIHNKDNPKNDSSVHGPRDDESILTPVPPDQRNDVQLRGRIPINGSPTVALSKPRRTTGGHEHQIGTWPARKENHASKYQKEFGAFVNAIDFDAI
jgi:hypothetical protein